MKKINDRTVETANKALRVIILLFLIFTVYIWISTVTLGRHTKHAAENEEENTIDTEMDIESEMEEQTVYQKYDTMPGFKISANDINAMPETDLSPEITDDTSNNADLNETDNFAFPNSYNEVLTTAEINTLQTTEEVQDAINYLYARSGCIFGNEEIQAFFETFDWYEGRYHVDEMNQNPLNYMTEIQYQNIELLAKRRNELNE